LRQHGSTATAVPIKAIRVSPHRRESSFRNRATVSRDAPVWISAVTKMTELVDSNAVHFEDARRRYSTVTLFARLRG
jgi:hypothetical protein